MVAVSQDCSLGSRRALAMPGVTLRTSCFCPASPPKPQGACSRAPGCHWATTAAPTRFGQCCLAYTNRQAPFPEGRPLVEALSLQPCVLGKKSNSRRWDNLLQPGGKLVKDIHPLLRFFPLQ